MTKKTKIILACIAAVLLIAVGISAFKIFGINSMSKMTVNVHSALKERNVELLCTYITDFDEKERNASLEEIITKELEKIYKSEDYEGILFAESLVKNLGTKAKYVKPAQEFCSQLKKIPEEYKYAKQKAYMKGYWVREDSSIYKNTVIIVAGREESLSASIRTVAPNYVGYKEGDPIWSGVKMYEEYRFSADILSRTKDVYFAYQKGFGTLNIDKGTITVSVNGEIQNWRKADYEEIKEMSYGYGAYQGTKWISSDNSDVTLEITQSAANVISFEVYNKEEDVKLVISGLKLTDGQADFDGGEGEGVTAGTIRIKGEKINVTFIDGVYPSGDYVLYSPK